MPAPDDLAVALARLGALGRSPSVDIRPVLLRVVVDLFLQRPVHAPADLRIFEAMVGPLLDQTDPETRRLVAAKLFAHPETPRGLLDRLVDDRMLAAAEAFRHAPLDEGELLATAERGPVTLALMVAHRRDLSEAVIEALAARTDPGIAMALAGNASAALSRDVFAMLVQRARGDSALATRLAGRTGDPIEVAALFPQLGAAARQRVIDAVRRLELGRREWGRPDGATAATLSRLDQLVLMGEWDGFDHVLAGALGCNEAALRPLLHDGTGDILALALAAAGANGDMAARAFILGEPSVGHSVQAVRRLTKLVDAIAPGAARRLIGSMLAGEELQPRRAAPHGKLAPATRRIEAAVGEALPARREPEAPAKRRGSA